MMADTTYFYDYIIFYTKCFTIAGPFFLVTTSKGEVIFPSWSF